MLRISGSPQADREPDPLDDTRIHPELYSLAVSMCSKALGSRRSINNNDDEQLVVEKAISRPERIEALDLVVKLC